MMDEDMIVSNISHWEFILRCCRIKAEACGYEPLRTAFPVSGQRRSCARRSALRLAEALLRLFYLRLHVIHRPTSEAEWGIVGWSLVKSRFRGRLWAKICRFPGFSRSQKAPEPAMLGTAQFGL